MPRKVNPWMPAVDRGEAFVEPIRHVIDPSLQKELLGHPGKWVTITRSELIAVGDSPLEVLKAARAKGFDSPILHYVPEDSRTHYFF